MDEVAQIECPHCGETFPLAIDASEGDAEFVVDCEVCCRPMAVRVVWEEGELVSVEVEPE
jgi:hypothetical protein